MALQFQNWRGAALISFRYRDGAEITVLKREQKHHYSPLLRGIVVYYFGHFRNDEKVVSPV